MKLYLSMTHRLATNYAKKYCNRTPIVKVIVENVVTCFLGHSVERYTHPGRHCNQRFTLSVKIHSQNDDGEQDGADRSDDDKK